MLRRGGVLLAGILLSFSAFATESDPHWEYSGAAGPEAWGDLSPNFTTCAKGKNQSPVDLAASFKAELPPLEFNYNTKPTEILNNGHTIQINFAPGSTFKLAGREFTLKQFHTHAPSEHVFAGRSFPLEGHFVHADADGNLAVVAVIYDVGRVSKAFSALWKEMPVKSGDKKALAVPITAAALLPAKWGYYLLSGSLTTPPCTEGVWWIVMKTPASLASQQLKAFTQVMGHPNNRPVQPTNARPVLQ